MAQEHLDTARLLALHEGDTGDFAALEHLASCADCQRAFDDTRWLLLLRKLPDLLKAGPHPGPDVLAAYRNHALSPERLDEIGKHLRACRECLALYRRGRVAERTAAYSSPSRALYRTTTQLFRPRPLRRLGTVMVARIGEGLRLVFAPEQAPRRVAESVLDWMPLEESASEAEVDKLSMVLSDDARFAGRSIGECGAVSEARPLRIPAGDLDIFLESGTEDDRPSLIVRLVPRDGERSASGVRIRLCRKKRDASEAVTDENGQATLPLDRGAKELVLDLEPPVALRIHFLG